jgi:hypothetical protein
VPSSKRLVGIICSMVLCLSLYKGCVQEGSAPPEYLVDAVALLAFGCLGLASIDKFTAVRSKSAD